MPWNFQVTIVDLSLALADTQLLMLGRCLLIRFGGF
jgi:hypothetical protein